MFVLKKWSALLLMSFVPLMSFVLTQIYFGFGLAVGVFLFMTLMMMLISNKMLDNPFRAMIEGKGLLLLKIDSTGIINPFVAKVQQPYITGKLGNKWINDIFNRKAVFSMSTPGTAKAVMDDKKKKLSLELGEKEFNDSRFGLFHYPVLLYNDQIKSLITKDFLSNKESTTFSDHGILYLNRRIEELSSHIRDFGRYIVESLNPKSGFLSGMWGYIIIGGAVILLFILFGPSILGAIQNTGGGAVVEGVGTAVSAVRPA